MYGIKDSSRRNVAYLLEPYQLTDVHDKAAGKDGSPADVVQDTEAPPPPPHGAQADYRRPPQVVTVDWDPQVHQHLAIVSTKVINM